MEHATDTSASAVNGVLPMPWVQHFDRRTRRAKSVAFHDKNPWLLVAFSDGVVSIYDLGDPNGPPIALVDAHEGMARAAQFHPTLPLFATGGDDCKVRLWSFESSQSVVEPLLGHLDYVRTVQFHPTRRSLLLSASDDQTLRLWNWETRACIGLALGHDHYAMMACFHPTQNLLLSASLDLTARLWLWEGDDAVARVTSLAVLEGHERGLNYAAFHPTEAVVATAADDRTVRLWRQLTSGAFEVTAVLCGHTSNVSAVCFLGDHKVLSVSEDWTARLWNVDTGVCEGMNRWSNDRFWHCAVTTAGLVALAADEGFSVYQLQSSDLFSAAVNSRLALTVDDAEDGTDEKAPLRAGSASSRRPFVLIEWNATSRFAAGFHAAASGALLMLFGAGILMVVTYFVIRLGKEAGLAVISSVALVVHLVTSAAFYIGLCDAVARFSTPSAEMQQITMERAAFVAIALALCVVLTAAAIFIAADFWWCLQLWTIFFCGWGSFWIGTAARTTISIAKSRRAAIPSLTLAMAYVVLVVAVFHVGQLYPTVCAGIVGVTAGALCAPSLHAFVDCEAPPVACTAAGTTGRVSETEVFVDLGLMPPHDFVQQLAADCGMKPTTGLHDSGGLIMFSWDKETATVAFDSSVDGNGVLSMVVTAPTAAAARSLGERGKFVVHRWRRSAA